MALDLVLTSVVVAYIVAVRLTFEKVITVVTNYTVAFLFLYLDSPMLSSFEDAGQEVGPPREAVMQYAAHDQLLFITIIYLFIYHPRTDCSLIASIHLPIIFLKAHCHKKIGGEKN